MSFDTNCDRASVKLDGDTQLISFSSFLYLESVVLALSGQFLVPTARVSIFVPMDSVSASCSQRHQTLHIQRSVTF